MHCNVRRLLRPFHGPVLEIASARRVVRLGITPFAWLLVIVASAGPALGHAPLPKEVETATQRIASAADPAAELLLRGEFHRLSGEWEAASADYDRAAALNPALPGLELCRASLVLDRGRLAEAHAALSRLLARNPGESRAWKLRARASEALGRPQAAAEDLARAIEITPNPPADLYVERSRLLVAAGSKAEALRCMDDGIARLGPIVTLELAAVDLELERGNSAGALARLDRVTAQMERPEKLLARRAEILAAGAAIGGAQATLSQSAIAASPAGESQILPAEQKAGSGAPESAPSPALAQAVVTRGPYLQIGTPSGVTIRWRTDVASSSRVLYGTTLGSLTSSAQDAALTTEHEITLTGLTPDQRYYYAIGTTTSVFEGDDAAHTFVTSPTPGTPKPTRAWIIGDAGTGTSEQIAVRDAFTAYNAGRPTDVWLMLGDNAYDSGTDSQYQNAVFDMYKGLLKNTILWPTRGNHDGVRSGPANDYYEFFSLPQAGQAGGLASGTEAYYSFDYGNIHFICLDSQGSDRSAGGAMATWVTNDLAATAREWVIAFWHHPPYSKGSHNSDSGGQLRDMRTNFLPIFDSLGVDVVFTGHSHSYERSFLLDGHYGLSTTLTNSMKVDPGDGRESGDGPYAKPTLGTGPHEGCVYAVAGSSGHTGGGLLNHPIMVSSLNVIGSVVMDVSGNRLDARFIDGNGAVRDSFTIMKGSGPSPGLTFIPTDDAQVASESPTLNYGSANTLRVRSVPTNNSYLKFNVVGLGGTVQSAKLNLYCTDASNEGGKIHLVSNDYLGTTTPWREDGLTWNNAPAIGGTPLDQKGAVSQNTWVEFDVTAAIVADGVYSFGLLSGSTNNAIYSSSEGPNRPELLVQVVPGSPNQTPVLAGIGNRTVDEGSPLTFTATATDADAGQALTFSLDAGAPGGAGINPTTGIFSWTPTEAQGPGVSPVTVRVTDNGSPAKSDIEAVTVTVREVNEAPVLAAIGDRTVDEGSPLAFTAVATDADLPANTLTFSLDGGAPAGAAIDATTGAFTWTPGDGQTGSFPITVRVADSGSPAIIDFEAITATVTGTPGPTQLTFIPADDARVASANPTVNYGSADNLRVRSAPTNHSYLKFNVVGLGGSVQSAKVRLFCTAATSEGGKIHLVSNDYLGTTTPWLEGGLTWNNAPAMGGTPLDQRGAVGANTWAEFDVTAAIVGDGTYSFGLLSGSTSLATYSSTEGANPPELVVQVAAGPPNQAPELAAIGDRTVDEGSLLSFTATATDADLPANTLTFSLDAGAPAGAAISGSTGVFSWTPASAQVGQHSVTVRVADDGAPPLSDSEIIQITVTAGPSQLTFIPSDDAHVKSSSVTTNYGSLTTLNVKSVSATFNSYLKFNVVGLSGTVESAKIRLYCTDASNEGGKIHLVSNNYLGTTTPWVEGGLIWNNAPAIGGSPLALKGAVSLDTWVEFDVTAAIVADGVYSFGLLSGSTNSVTYSSAEGGNPPELVVQVISGAPNPAPVLDPVANVQAVPRAFGLRQNHPNPFNPETSIRFELPRPGAVRLTVFNSMGRAVRTLVDGPMPAGFHEVSWNGLNKGGRRVSSGVYFLRLEAQGLTSTRKASLMR